MIAPVVAAVTVGRRKSVPYVIWLAIGVHAVWGLALIADPLVAPAAILIGLHWFLALGIEGAPLGVVLFGASVLAGASLVVDQRIGRIASLGLLTPQYALLIAALVSDTQSVITSSVDGRTIDRLLLFTALWPVMLMALLHSASIVERHWTWSRR